MNTTENLFSELKAYVDRFEAETIRIRLASAGITALVTGTDAATALGLGGAPSTRLVRIEVHNDDVARASQILEEDRRRATESNPWKCTDCGETNEGTFDLCWNCSGGAQGDATVVDATATEPIAIDENWPENAFSDSNPYRPVQIESSRQRSTLSDRTELHASVLSPEVKRAFLTSIVGLLVLPPAVSCYGIYRLMRLSELLPKSPTLRGIVIASWCINSANLFVWAIFWLGVLSM